MEKDQLRQIMAKQVTKKILQATSGISTKVKSAGNVIDLETERLKRRPR